MGAGLPQHVPEQHLLQLLRRDGGQLHLGGNGDGLAGLRRVQQLLGLLYVEVRPHLLRHDGAGLLVIGGVLHHAGAVVVDLLGGEGLGGNNGKFNVNARGILHAGRSTAREAQPVPQFRLVQRAAIPGLDDGDRVFLHCIGAVHSVFREPLCNGIHSILKLVAAQLVSQPGAGIPAGQRAQIHLALHEKSIVLQVIHAVLRPVFKRHRAVSRRHCLRTEPQVLQCYRHQRRPGILLHVHRIGCVIDGDFPFRRLLFQLFLGLLNSQARHIHPIDMEVGIEHIQRVRIGAHAHIGRARQNHQDPHNNSHNDQRLSAAFFQPLRRGGFVRIRFHEAPPVVPSDCPDKPCCPSLCIQVFILARFFWKSITIL